MHNLRGDPYVCLLIYMLLQRSILSSRAQAKVKQSESAWVVVRKGWISGFIPFPNHQEIRTWAKRSMPTLQRTLLAPLRLAGNRVGTLCFAHPTPTRWSSNMFGMSWKWN
jgi:hypothetical protein